MQIANSRRAASAALIPLQPAGRPGAFWPPRANDNFRNAATALVNAVCHARRGFSTYVQRAIRAIILINRRHPFVPRMCYLDDIIKSSAAAAFLNPRPDSLAGCSQSSEQKPPFRLWLPQASEKHKYLAKIKEEKFCAEPHSLLCFEIISVFTSACYKKALYTS
jgi:hypothetical protein